MMTTPTICLYTSNVFTVGPSIWCGVATIVMAAGILSAIGASVVVTLVITLVIAMVVALFVLATAQVRVTIARDEVAYRAGFGRWRTFARSAVKSSECVKVGAAAIVGIGIPPSWSTARHIVRAGPVLHLEIENGEHIWLSITNPPPERMTTAPESSSINERAQE